MPREKSAEKIIRENLSLLQSAMESTTDGILIVDRNNKTLFFNKKFQAILKISDKLAATKDGKKMMAHAASLVKDSQKFTKRVQYISSHPSEEYFDTIHFKDGTIVERYSIPQKSGKGIIGRVLNFRDVTERKKAQEKLRESEERYRAIFEQAADSIVLIDTETGELVDFNDRTHENLGYTREEFRKLKIGDFEAIESPGEVAEHIENIVRDGFDTFETKHRRKDGEIRNIYVSTRAISIGGKVFLMAIWRDITENRRAEEIMQKSHDELGTRVEERTEELAKANEELQKQKSVLEKKNVAFSEVIEQIEVEKSRIKDDVATNVSQVLIPILAKLKINKSQQKYLDLLQHHLKELVSSFGREITKTAITLSPREIEICTMVKAGLTSKEIASLLNVSLLTIEKHRKNIRRKLGISNKRINLTSFLYKF